MAYEYSRCPRVRSLLAGCTVHPPGEQVERHAAMDAGKSFQTGNDRQTIPSLPDNPTPNDMVDHAVGQCRTGTKILGMAVGDRANSAGRHASHQSGPLGKPEYHARLNGTRADDGRRGQRSDGGHRAAAQAIRRRPSRSGKCPRGRHSLSQGAIRSAPESARRILRLRAHRRADPPGKIQFATAHHHGNDNRGAQQCRHGRSAGTSQSPQ